MNHETERELRAKLERMEIELSACHKYENILSAELNKLTEQRNLLAGQLASRYGEQFRRIDKDDWIEWAEETTA